MKNIALVLVVYWHRNSEGLLFFAYGPPKQSIWISTEWVPACSYDGKKIMGGEEFTFASLSLTFDKIK